MNTATCHVLSAPYFGYITVYTSLFTTTLKTTAKRSSKGMANNNFKKRTCQRHFYDNCSIFEMLTTERDNLLFKESLSLWFEIMGCMVAHQVKKKKVQDLALLLATFLPIFFQFICDIVPLQTTSLLGKLETKFHKDRNVLPVWAPCLSWDEPKTCKGCNWPLG